MMGIGGPVGPGTSDAFAGLGDRHTVRDELIQRAPDDVAATAGDKRALGDLSRYALFAGAYEEAIAAAERALKADPDMLWIAANRAHALMFLGRRDEARETYMSYKDRRIHQMASKTWQQLIAEDFAELRAAGRSDALMGETEVALGIAKR
jgi:predicted Zn-dependent protease